MTSKLHPTVRLYKEATTDNSTIEQGSIVGDGSRVRQSIVGEYCRIDRQNLLLGVTLGDRSYTGPWNMIFHTKIGKYCSISYGVTIGPPDHNYSRISSHPFIYNPEYGLTEEVATLRDEKFSKPCTIGNDVWIGCNATILRGVKVGDGAVIGANSLVNRDVPPYAIVGGVPARIIRYRFDERVVEQLLRIRWWDWSDEKIRAHIALFQQDNISVEELEELDSI